MIISLEEYKFAGIVEFLFAGGRSAPMTHDVLIVGGGVAGLSAGIFTARAGLDTVVVDGDESILARNAHLENYPGFPGGIDARRYLSMVRDQAAEAGCDFVDGLVTDLSTSEGESSLDTAGFTARLEDAGTIDATFVVAASWSDVEYLSELDVKTSSRGTKEFIDVDGGGRSTVDGLYAAGRLAGQPHQAIVAAGHGATVGLAVIHDSEANFYHDWVAPTGYFTGRGRDVPPACEEIDDEERRRREEHSRERLREHLSGDPTEPVPHPSLREE